LWYLKVVDGGAEGEEREVAGRERKKNYLF
jgi:hypothetical protein